MEDLEHDSDTDSDPAYARGYDSPTDGDDLNLNNGTSMSLSLSLRYYTMCCDIDALVVVIVIEPDPFYDELADDRNEQWVRNNLSSRTARKTDAVLNCPSCFSVLSVDCQRYTSLPHVAYCLTHSLTPSHTCSHAFYENQFRAMFVSNCRVVLNHSIRYRVHGARDTKRAERVPDVVDSRTAASDVMDAVLAAPTEQWELYHPVQCVVCEVEVAVYEPGTELFHFHNVFVSY